MTQRALARFQLPDDGFYRPESFPVLCWHQRSPWLAELNRLGRTSSAPARWTLRSCSETAQLQSELENFKHAMVLIALDLRLFQEQIDWTSRISRRNADRTCGQKIVAIVGTSYLSQDEQADQRQQSSRQLDSRLRKLEIAFRAAGAEACFWDLADADRLVRLIDRFGQSLPRREISLKEYVLDSLPWKIAARK